MLGIEFINQKKSFWLPLAIIGLVPAVLGGVMKGPVWVFIFSGPSLLACLFHMLAALRTPDPIPGKGLMIFMAVLHSSLLLLAIFLYRFLLMPLPSEALNLPLLNVPVTASGKGFKLKGPEGWNSYDPKVSKMEGVVLRPAGFDSFMGVMEGHVQVRILNRSSVSDEELLSRIARSFTPDQKKQKSDIPFSFQTELGQLLDGRPAVWTTLDANKLWIPMRQITLIGLKGRSTLCSVSITGLKAHDTLFRVMALGLFETVKLKTAIK